MSERNVNLRVNIDRGRNSGAEDIKRVRRDADGLEKDLRQAARAADDLDRNLEKAARGADFGRVGGGLERVLGGAVGGGSQELLGLAGDIGDVIEGLVAEPGGLKAALKGLISPAGLLSVGLAGAGLAVAAFTAELDRQREAATQAAQELAAAAQSEESYIQLLEKSGTAAIENAKKEQQAQFEIQAAAVQALDARRKELQVIVDGQRARGTFLTQEQADLDALNAEYDKHAAALYGVHQNILILNDIMGGTEFAAKRAAEGFEQLTAFAETGRGAVETLGGLLSGTLENVAEMAQETADAADKAFTDLQETTQAAVDKLSADGDKLGDALRTTIAGLNADLIAAQEQANADIVAARAEAAAAELEAVEMFTREQARAQRDFEREQKRIKDDARRAELDAIEQNDILALLNARDSSKEQLRENRQRFKDEQADRAADFEARRQAEALALEQTIAGINARRDEEIAGINARIVEERKAFDAAIAEVNRLKDAHIAQIDAVIAANATKHAAELAAVETVKQGWESIVLYRNGLLYQINPLLKNSPPTADSLLAVPPPPVDPFGFGNFFNNAGPEGTLSTPPPTGNTPPVINFNEGAVVVGDLASQGDLERALGAVLNLFFQQRTGAAA